jgi:hypothetical protein
MANFLGQLGNFANRIGQGVADVRLNNLAIDDPDRYSVIKSREDELDQRRQERARQIAQQQRTQEMLQNPEILGRLSTQFGLPPEVIVNVGSLDELATLGNISRPSEDPAAIRSTQWYMNASPEQKAAFDRVNKVGVDKVDIGDEVLFIDKSTGQVIDKVSKTLAPSDKPETKAAQTQAVADVDLEMKPKIEQETKFASEVGKDLGESQAQYSTLKASYPQLIDTTDRLAKLAQVATYTKAGKWNDAAKRQLGINVGDAGEAAAEMTTIIDVEVLPLLKPTFGAAFTVNEGEWLRNTMGNPDLSPEEKVSQIQARVRGWDNQLKTLETKLGVPQDQRMNLGNTKTIKWGDF